MIRVSAGQSSLKRLPTNRAKPITVLRNVRHRALGAFRLVLGSRASSELFAWDASHSCSDVGSTVAVKIFNEPFM